MGAEVTDGSGLQAWGLYSLSAIMPSVQATGLGVWV